MKTKVQVEFIKDQNDIAKGHITQFIPRKTANQLVREKVAVILTEEKEPVQKYKEHKHVANNMKRKYENFPGNRTVKTNRNKKGWE